MPPSLDRVLTMPTNVTQKDKTLQEVIHWCELERDNIEVYVRQAYWLDDVTKTLWDLRMRVYGFVIDHCKGMLGYSGSMPLEVENQSEDAK